MFRRKMRTLSFVIMVITAAVLSSFLVISSDRTMAQAQNKDSGQKQGPGMGLGYQRVLTSPNVLKSPAKVERSDKEDYAAVKDRLTKPPFIGPQSTNSGFENVPPSAFRHDGASPASGYLFLPTEGSLLNKSYSWMCMAAPVYLPDGSTFYQFTMYFVDDNATLDMGSGTLWRRKHASAPDDYAEVVADLDFLYGTGIDDPAPYWAYSRLIVTSGAEYISNAYGYYITYCFDPGTGAEHRIYGFSVDYY